MKSPLFRCTKRPSSDSSAAYSMDSSVPTMRYDFSNRIESMARMPNGASPRSPPASISVSKMWFWYSMGWCSSHPSSPT